MGATHGNNATYPRLASMLGYIDKKDLHKVVYEIATTQRDYGNREDRKLSRLKYTIDTLGLDVFIAEVEKRSGVTFFPAKPYKFTHRTDDFGWAKNHEGKWYYTAFVEAGRVFDADNVSFKQAFLEIAQARKADFRFSCNQNIIVSDVEQQHKDWVNDILTKYNVIKVTENASLIRKDSIACVALNTCPLALAEGQRYLPSLLDKIDTIIDKYQLNNEHISIRMTGCPNCCARPYTAEIGFVGTSLGHYNMMLGADNRGERLNKLYKESLDEKAILIELDNLLDAYSSQKKASETFGDFTLRKGIVH